MYRALSTAAAITAFFSAGTPIAFAQQRAIIDLGTLGGAWSRPYAVNQHLTVVGSSELDSPQRFYRGFFWERTSGMWAFDTFGGPQSKARCINNSGVVVGWAADGVNGFRPFRWEASTGMVDLGTFGGPNGKCRWINEQGQIVGFALDTENNQRAFLWEEGTGLTNLGTVGGSWSEARCINNLTQIAGVSGDETENEHAFYYDQANGMVNLGTFGGPQSAAYALNDFAEVVGDAQKPNNKRVAFYWTPQLGAIQELPSLGGSGSLARGINNDGTIVGRAQDVDQVWQAVTWDRDGNISNLNDVLGNSSPWRLQSAQCINQAGYIGGVGIIDGESHAFLLTPPLAISDPSPGQSGRFNTWTMTGTLPQSQVYFVYSHREGVNGVPNCPGVRVLMARPKISAPLATVDGQAEIRLWVSRHAAGQELLYQVVEPASCRVSELGRFVFP